MIPAFALRYLPHALAVLAALGVAWWGYSSIWDRGYASCRAEWNQAAADAAMRRDAELEVARLRGDALSEGLAKKEREYGNLRSEYLAYANAIPGVCDPALGVLVGAASTGTPLPATPGAHADPAAAVGAAAIAANIAANYPRCWECIARLNTLIDWHAGSQGSVTPKKEEK